MRVQTSLTAGILLAAAWCGPALAWTGEVSWPTFYRSGPGRAYTVLDEMDRGKSLDVLACEGGWCQVRIDSSVGYIEQSAIVQAGAAPAKPSAPGAEGCVQSRVTGPAYQKGLYYEFCPRSPG